MERLAWERERYNSEGTLEDIWQRKREEEKEKETLNI